MTCSDFHSLGISSHVGVQEEASSLLASFCTWRGHAVSISVGSDCVAPRVPKPKGSGRCVHLSVKAPFISLVFRGSRRQPLFPLLYESRFCSVILGTASGPTTVLSLSNYLE
jgi:hypothetical protein